MNRRSFISLGLTVAAFGSIPFIASSSNTFKFEPTGFQPIHKLLSVLRDKQSAVHVGGAILKNSEAPISLPDLLISIMDKLDLSFETLNSIHHVDLKARLKQRTVVDFDCGATVNADGWMLGQTESQLCALAAQTHTSLSLSTLLSENANA